ncbi:MAG: phosphoribosylglycinamide formyltransferase [Pseudoclavibacter caeni]
MLNVVVLISGIGSNLQALIDAEQADAETTTGTPDEGAPRGAFHILAVGADRPAAGLDRAAGAGLPVFRVDYDRAQGRAAWGRRLVAAVDDWHPDVIVLSGLMRILPPEAVAHWRGRIVNTHPALLPAFPGAHAVRDALAAGVTATGATVHLVDEGVDTGPVLAQEAVPVLPGDDEELLHARIKAVERRLLAGTLRDIDAGRIPLPAEGHTRGGAAHQTPQEHRGREPRG